MASDSHSQDLLPPYKVPFLSKAHCFILPQVVPATVTAGSGQVSGTGVVFKAQVTVTVSTVAATPVTMSNKVVMTEQSTVQIHRYTM